MIVGATRREGEAWRECVSRYAAPYGLQRECLEIFDAAVASGETEQDSAAGALAAWDLLERVTGALPPEKKSNLFMPLHEPGPGGLKHRGKWVKVPPQAIDDMERFWEEERARKFDVVEPRYTIGPENKMSFAGWVKSPTAKDDQL